MKKLLILIGFGLAFNVSAIDVSATYTNGAALNFTNVVNGGARISLVSIVNSINLANNFTIWDAPVSTNGAAALNLAVLGQNVISNSSGQLCFTNPAYASIVQYTTNIKVFYTNFMGLTNWQLLGGLVTNPVTGGWVGYTNNPVVASNVLWTTTNTVSGSLIPYRLLFSGSIGGAATLTLTNSFNCVYGLLFSTPTVASNIVNITYTSSL